MPAIDIWCNNFTPEGIRKYYLDDPEMQPFFQGQLGERLKGYPVKEFLRVLDEAGVDKVLVPSCKHRSWVRQELHWDIPDEEVAELCAPAPDRLVGIAGINPFERMAGVRKLERAVREYGFRGAHIHAYGFGVPINDRMFYPYYGKCAELGVPVIIQVGHAVNLMPSAMGRPLLLDDVALYFPELTIVGAQTGWPWVEEMIALAWKHPNVYLGASGHAPRYWEPSLVRFIDSRGQDKCVWGTDYPLLHHAETLQQVEALGLKEQAKRKLLRDNAARIFGFDGAGAR